MKRDCGFTSWERWSVELCALANDLFILLVKCLKTLTLFSSSQVRLLPIIDWFSTNELDDWHSEIQKMKRDKKYGPFSKWGKHTFARALSSTNTGPGDVTPTNPVSTPTDSIGCYTRSSWGGGCGVCQWIECDLSIFPIDPQHHQFSSPYFEAQFIS